MDVQESEPLARFPVLRTGDRDEAQHVVSRIYVAHELTASAPVQARLNLAHTSLMTFGYLTYGAHTMLQVPPMSDCYHLNLTLHGHTMVRHGPAETTTRAGADGVLLSPQQDSTLTWSPDAAQFAVKIPAPVLRAHLSSLLHEPVDEPSFALHVDLTTDAGHGLLGAASFLATQLAHGDLGPLIREQLESYLMTQLLLGAEHRYSARLRDPGRSAERQAVDEAVEYIETFPDRALGIAEIAAATSTDAPRLAAAFEQELGTAPEEYVRQVRLERAHAQLAAHQPGDSLADVARQWGFADLHRFRAAYRTRYGCEPATG